MKYHMNDVTKNNFHFVLITEEEYFDYSTYEYRVFTNKCGMFECS